MIRARFLLAACGLALGVSLVAQPAQNERSARLLRLETFVLPDFPEFLRRTGVGEGTVAVAIGHDARGRPDDVLVLEASDSRFADAALDAIAGWRFAAPAATDAPREVLLPIVRFLFTTTGVSVMSPSVADPSKRKTRVRADSPVELPNFSHLDSVPKARVQPMPAATAPPAGVSEGVALVKFFVDQEGRARIPVAITSTTPAFGAAAVAAVRQWRFEPPRIDGQPVVALESQVFRFGSPASR